ncbi:calcium/sodium antiporter [Halomonas shantousis]
MLLPLIAVVIGLIGLVWSADRFVEGAAATAYRAGMSKLLVGLTIVSIGTSAPEILVSFMASLTGKPDLATGNALGSNIANLGLVLGITALVAPVPIHASLVRRELPLLMVATLLAGAVLIDGMLGIKEGVLLLALLAISLWAWIRTDAPGHEQDQVPNMTLGRGLTWLVVGLVLLSASSRLLVWGASHIAAAFGISDLVIGLTVVAIGTSLPELAASVASALKRQHDIAIGNIIGSNLFNMLIVLPIPALLSPGPTDPQAPTRDYPVMLGLTLLLGAALVIRRHATLGRPTGALLLATYLTYMTILVLGAVPGSPTT